MESLLRFLECARHLSESLSNVSKSLLIRIASTLTLPCYITQWWLHLTTRIPHTRSNHWQPDPLQLPAWWCSSDTVVSAESHKGVLECSLRVREHCAPVGPVVNLELHQVHADLSRQIRPKKEARIWWVLLLLPNPASLCPFPSATSPAWSFTSLFCLPVPNCIPAPCSIHSQVCRVPPPRLLSLTHLSHP